MAVTWNPIINWDSEGWRDQAACHHTELALFFPVGGTGLIVKEIQAAKAVCRACPVQGACLRFALETNQESGIWGGKDENERRTLSRGWRTGRNRGRGAAMGLHRP